MPEANDTVDKTETDANQTTEPIVDESTDATVDPTAAEVVETKTENALTPEDAEKLRKENQKLQMELNQRRNETKAAEEGRKAAELKALEDEGKFKELAEKLAADNAEREAAEKRQEAEDFRSKIIDEYGTEVAAKARKLNLYWDEAADFATAEAQLRAKLDVLKGDAPVTSTPKDDTEIHPNNPSSTDLMGPDFDSLTLDQQLEKLRKDLKRAPSR